MSCSFVWTVSPTLLFQPNSWANNTDGMTLILALWQKKCSSKELISPWYVNQLKKTSVVRVEILDTATSKSGYVSTFRACLIRRLVIKVDRSKLKKNYFKFIFLSYSVSDRMSQIPKSSIEWLLKSPVLGCVQEAPLCKIFWFWCNAK